MDTKYYLGYEEVGYERFMGEKYRADALGNTVELSRMAGKYPEYVLKNGTVIRADGMGHFHRMEGDTPMEAWQVGTENEIVQGEQDGQGRADFFVPVTEEAEDKIG